MVGVNTFSGVDYTGSLFVDTLEDEDRDYVGGGRKTIIFTAEEENKLKEFVTERLSLGCGLDFHQLCLTIQELIGRLRVANPDRQFSTDWDSDYPNDSWARRFMERHKLVLRRTMALSNARARKRHLLLWVLKLTVLMCRQSDLLLSLLPRAILTSQFSL